MGTKGWDINEYLLAALVDASREANWQRQGKPSAKRPERIKTPVSEGKDTRIIGSEPIPIKEFTAWWDSQGGERG